MNPVKIFHYKTMSMTLPVLILTFLSGAIAQDAGQVYVEGIVYADENLNGVHDPDEPRLSGILVSNQEEVTLTDQNGYYRLPIQDESVVFVTKPAGYELPLNENNLPLFYYIHQPGGSPELDFPGLEPTRPLPSSLDFGLIPGEKKEAFSAVVFGDPQPRDHTELSYFRDGVVSELMNVDVDMTLVLGDIMFDDLSLFDRYNQIMKTIDMPVYNIIGNHDLNFDSDQLDEDPNRYARETFKRMYGPTYYSFEYGDVHFITMDNMDYLGRNENGRATYRGYLNDKHLSWIENNLKHVSKDKLIVLLSHIPLYAMEHDRGNVNTMNRTELFQLLEDFDRVLYLGGHRHLTYQHFLGTEFGRMNPNPIHHIATTAACGSWWSGPMNKRGIPVAIQQDGVPNGYHIFQFEGNTYRETYKGAGLPSGYQIRIESPANNLTETEFQESELLVNVFNGSERSEVRYRINDEEWLDMQRVNEQSSPFFTALYEGSNRRPTLTNHIWRADLPALKKGIYKISVWTKDMYGQEFTQNKVIEIE